MTDDDHDLPPTSVLFERHGAMVYRRCLRILRNEEEAKDAVQEVFLNVLSRRSQFRGASSPSTWLYGAATLHCLQKLRNRERRDGKLATLAETAPDAAPPLNEEHLALGHLLELESDEVRLSTYYRYVDGMSLEEVAQAVGRSRKTVSAHLNGFLARARSGLDLEETP
jgi:RNA polymerase sigma-70 factor (ECF subfamily)